MHSLLSLLVLVAVASAAPQWHHSANGGSVTVDGSRTLISGPSGSISVDNGAKKTVYRTIPANSQYPYQYQYQPALFEEGSKTAVRGASGSILVNSGGKITESRTIPAALQYQYQPAPVGSVFEEGSKTLVSGASGSISVNSGQKITEPRAILAAAEYQYQPAIFEGSKTLVSGASGATSLQVPCLAQRLNRGFLNEFLADPQARVFYNVDPRLCL